MATVQGTDYGKKNGRAATPEGRIAMPQQIVASGIAQHGQLRSKWIYFSGE